MGNQTCSYCYQYGHTAMGCPEAKAWVKTHMAVYKAEKAKNPEVSLWCIRHRHGWDSSAERAFELWEAKQKRAKQTKTCNFCSDIGHNKRTCPKLKETAERMVKANANYREALLAFVKQQGIGVGALLQKKTHDRYLCGTGWASSPNVLCVVTKVKWDSMGITGNQGVFHWGTDAEVELTIPTLGETITVDFPWMSGKHPNATDYDKSEYRDHDFELLSPATPLPPSGWLTGESLRDEFVKLLKHKDSAYWQFKEDIEWGDGAKVTKWCEGQNAKV